MTAAEFWSSTPYLTAVATRAFARRQYEMAVTTGWMAERFAREERLSGLAFYLKDNPAPDLQAETEEAEMTRWAMAHGLEIVDLTDEEAAGE
jgi:hypothetical protein